jgi:hypothetical protein
MHEMPRTEKRYGDAYHAESDRHKQSVDRISHGNLSGHCSDHGFPDEEEERQVGDG